jgi:hypothetical protein
VVEETLLRAEACDNSGIEVLLDHQEEPNVVRGYSEVKLDPDFAAETVRRDGGSTFDHGPTKCYMIAVPLSYFDGPGERMSRWNLRTMHSEWRDTLSDLTDYSLAPADSTDVYVWGSDNTKKQLYGVSARVLEDTVLLRACWYDQEVGEETRRMVEEDMALIEEDDRLGDPDFSWKQFKNSCAWDDEVYKNILHEGFQSSRAEEFYSEEARKVAERYMHSEHGNRQPSRCIGPASD